MMRQFTKAFGSFRKSESGNATIEFAITFPAVMMLLLSGIELAMVSLQHAMLERAMDMTVRDIRLSTGASPQHDEIKDLLCERTGFIDNCSTNMRLQMVEVDPRNWNWVGGEAQCVDHAEDAEPVFEFKQDAGDNALMVLRACAKIDPIFPTTGLGAALKEADGQFALVSVSAFVQEPR